MKMLEERDCRIRQDLEHDLSPHLNKKNSRHKEQRRQRVKNKDNISANINIYIVIVSFWLQHLQYCTQCTV